MAETVTEQKECEKCGSEVRENTQFCYNCGARYLSETGSTNGSAPETDQATEAVDDLPIKIDAGDEADDKLAKAAAVRKKSRVKQKKPKVEVWETGDDNGLRVLAFALLIAVIAALAVAVTVYWK